MCAKLSAKHQRTKDGAEVGGNQSDTHLATVPQSQLPSEARPSVPLQSSHNQLTSDFPPTPSFFPQTPPQKAVASSVIILWLILNRWSTNR